jgi:hypothetical protein
MHTQKFGFNNPFNKKFKDIKEPQGIREDLPPKLEAKSPEPKGPEPKPEPKAKEGIEQFNAVYGGTREVPCGTVLGSGASNPPGGDNRNARGGAEFLSGTANLPQTNSTPY